MMSPKMKSFLNHIHIDNVEDFDIDFQMVQRNRFNREQIDMIIVKETLWEYDLLNRFQEGLNTITYPYFLRFSYIQRPKAEDAINLFKNWYRSIYRLPLDVDVQVKEDNDEVVLLAYKNEEQEYIFKGIVSEFRSFLGFICYDNILLDSYIKPEEIVVDPEVKEQIEKVAEEVATISIENEKGERDFTDKGEAKAFQSMKEIVEEKTPIAETENKQEADKASLEKEVEDEFLRMMRENAIQLKKDRERMRLNKRGNYTMYERISDITRKTDGVDIVVKIYSKEVSEYGNKSLTLGLYDEYQDAIVLRIGFNKLVTEDFVKKLENKMKVRVRGKAYFDEYNKTMMLRGHYIDVLPPDEVQPEPFETNRVELHLHTNMSTQDGISGMIEYAQYAKQLGHKAIAITDHGALQGYPEAQKAAKMTGLKVLYGCEFYMVDDQLEYIKNPSETELNKACYVVLDLETTGLSCVYNRIIEFGAVKVRNGLVVEHKDILINPECNIPAKITEITHITNEDVRNKKTIAEVLPEIVEWLGDAILVTHNANFDISFLQESLKRCDMPILTNPVIDTLALSRYIFPENRNHRLGTLCKNFEIEYNEDEAHRADYDAEVLNNAWQPMIVRLTKENKHLRHCDLANLVTPSSLLSHIRPKHIVVLVKDLVGLKDLFKLVTYSQIDYLADVPKIPRRIVEEHRSHLLIGSACFNGDVFETARYYNNDVLKKTMEFYDYIEIQPAANYSHLVNMKDLDEEDVPMLLKNIVNCADEIGKLVCATGDAHYCRPSDKIFRDVMISAPGLGGTVHPLNPFKRQKMPFFENPDQHYRSTQEMLDAMAFLGEEKAKEIVITNTNIIADQIESIKPVPNDHLYTPAIPNSDTNLRETCFRTAKELYGDPLPELIQERLDKELDGIIGNGYSVTYWIAHLIVKKANEDGFIVGSRGSVGSSFAATMAGITEVNALPPHYRCPHCKHVEWTSEEYPNITSGYDLPEKICPICGEKMVHDGQNIPFQTFLGFSAEKTPDIDLNFPNDYQSRAHDYTKELLGADNCFRAGTISTVEAKTAFGFARGYLERKGLNPDDFPRPKIAYISSGCIGVKRTTGQHPGGIVVVPKTNDVFDFTPVQYPAEDKTAAWKTTHFDFESIHDTLLKLDLLGHVDPIALKMMATLTNIDIKSIPLNDENVLSIFSSPDALKMDHDYMKSETGALAIPEFGTNFVRGILEETRPKTFSDLVIISGLSHGTNVWNGNADELIKNGTATLQQVIGCRDDIMTYLISMGLPHNVSFKIMEDVRKGRGLKEEYIEIMKANKVPQYYIDSCLKIKYLFPKGHAVAYVTMAIRVGYFKVYYPLEFYATFFSVRSKQYDIQTMINGKQSIIDRIEELKAKSSKGSKEKISNKEEDQLKTLYIALEMVQRGYKFSNINLYKSDATNFVVDHETKSLIPPFITIDQLGENNAITVVEARKEGKFYSKEELLRRTKLTKTNVDALSAMGVLDGLDETDQLSLFDF